MTAWDIRESGPADALRTVLMLPGGMCTAMFYEELMAEPRLADVHSVAVTLPGHGENASADGRQHGELRPAHLGARG